MLLNFIYLVHAALALILALLLLFYPEWVTEMITAVPWAPGVIADICLVFARFTAVGMVLVVLSTSFARQSASTRVRWAAVVSMLIISLVGLAVSLMIPFQPLQIYAILLNGIFVLAYLWILNFNSDEI